MVANDKYRRRSIRLKGYDYSQTGSYFVTVCSWNRECMFGDIIDDQMKLRAFGEIVQACWYDLPRHHSQVGLDAFVVMPNHVHGVVVLQGLGAQHAAPLRYDIDDLLGGIQS